VQIPTLETERLVLRPFRESDLDAYAAMKADPEVIRYLGQARPGSRADSWREMALLIGHWQLRGYGLWAVEEKGTGAFVGRIGLWNPEGWPGLEVGWTLARAHWGQGFATEGGRASLDYAFDQLSADHVVSVIQPDNAASIRVAQKLGERFERKSEVSGHPVLIYGIHRQQGGRPN